MRRPYKADLVRELDEERRRFDTLLEENRLLYERAAAARRLATRQLMSHGRECRCQDCADAYKAAGIVPELV